MSSNINSTPPPIRIRNLSDAFDYGMHQLLQVLPFSVASAIGAPFGAFAGRFMYKKLNLRIDAHLAKIRPDLDAAERERLIRWRWRHLGRCHTEIPQLHRFMSGGHVEVIGGEHLMRPGPRMVAVAHMGNWETPGTTMLALTGRGSGPYQPPSSDIRHALVYAARRRYGLTIGPPGRLSAMIVARELKRGGVAFFYTDEVLNGRRQGPSFEGPPPPDGNIAAAARMAYRYNAPIIPGYCLRIQGAKLRMIYEEPIIPNLSAPEAEERARLAADLNARVRSWVTAHPEQWFMLHDRPREDYP